jgi:hypothetical protein
MNRVRSRLVKSEAVKPLSALHFELLQYAGLREAEKIDFSDFCP